MWYGNASNQDCKALQRVVCLAERISGSALPSLQVIYFKRCKSRAAKIIKDSNYPGNRLFIWQALPEHDGKNWETEEELLPSGHQALKLKLSLITFTRLNLINCKTSTILHHPHSCYVYIPGTTCLHILLAHPCLYYYLLSLQYTVLHILFYCTFYSSFFYSYFLFFTLFFSYLYLCIFSCVCIPYNCTVHGADLTYISLLVTFCIIVYVTNKSWILNLLVCLCFTVNIVIVYNNLL